MRRRRRQPTQFIKKKSQSTSTYPQISSAKSQKSTAGRFFSRLFFILIIAAISYFIYDITLNRDIVLEEDKGEPVAIAPIETEEEESSPSTTVPEPPFKKNIQIEILNGCGVNGVAKSFQNYLREQGFDVVNTENYSENNKLRWDVEQSFIIDHVDNIEQAEAVARSLKIPEERVVKKNTANPIYDISVVIGKDYRQLNGAN